MGRRDRAYGLLATWRNVALAALLLVLLTGCKAELYKGLNEEQANTMLATLLKRGIEVEKQSEGKNGYTLSVERRQVVQALEVLRENSLPREQYQSLGKVFSGDGMIASPSEEKARLSYAISQELADTFSRIDGVLTARAHVVLASADVGTDTRTPASAAVFLRHTEDSPVVNLIPKIREMTAKAVPGLDYEKVSVMLVPVRESVTVPLRDAPTLLGIPLPSDSGPSYLLAGAAIALLCALLALALMGVRAGLATLEARKNAAADAKQHGGD
ncbi:type III secretion system inner membrane ring lipoprotein SctJ [Nitratidesulfovibrio vulgaris]|uniref:type III secretion system inner membrane ring lipoprotein SctJ n=1 Tax=Nitratidesulfovibrio vulgaris TaxID=881 RepID=UPI002300327F|nr:type III secretion inner membrane ring lipoprotein SctJ [Nitratidesulfovibrio vulgaris]WCB48207.1 type III secretion inner membrane ring lipoprotein SctJ [Nitratidesulfovibrio vulgaris]